MAKAPHATHDGDVLSPMCSPPHSNHSRESSTSHFSGSLKPVGSTQILPKEDGSAARKKAIGEACLLEDSSTFFLGLPDTGDSTILEYLGVARDLSETVAFGES
ncbi:hypothetical protein LIER_34439 [Lithospermum erythrorhizon]|uniref:Uncharacterized protein n=1 Tax=Lithospermum erythrorhizon TaxID=34254 RepID=A0AAV3S465_LITER